MSQEERRAKKRLIEEFKKMQKVMEENDPPDMRAKADPNDMFHWTAIIPGPKGTPWEKGLFKLDFQFPHDFPNYPPAVKFLSHVFHPNVYDDGRICLDILQKEWKQTYGVIAILNSIQILLANPNTDSPANHLASDLCKAKDPEYLRRITECAEESLRCE